MIKTIRANGETKEVEKLPTFAEARGFVGGFIEVVNLPGGMAMLVDEDGIQKGKPFNQSAAFLYGGNIVGNVIYGTAREISKICGN